MKLFAKEILLISPENWNELNVSKHHYAIHLAELDNHVYFLNPPSNRYNSSESEIHDNITIIDYPGFWPGLRWLPKGVRRWHLKRVLRNIELIIDANIEIIWSFDNSIFYQWEKITDKLKISHIVDLNMDFNFAFAAQGADICLSCSHEIVKRQKRFNSNSFFIQHGYSIRTAEPFDLNRGLNEIKIGYAGNLNIPYIDWDILTSAIKELANTADFYLAGSYNDIPIETQSNVYLLGVLSTSELRWFYEQMDILIIAYDTDKYMQQVSNPHKMLEYLGSGSPIVSTFCSEYIQLDDCICMSKQKKEWPDKLKHTLHHLEFWNSTEKRQKRIAYAKENSYSNQLKRIESLLDEFIE
ncbi:MAG: glycosyltransferase [Fulvivirga sp.]|uniref:glycosyltransferase n=1 Tax=Fulvivirga sp. TaxID=1931237 RepID=UPI0032EB78A5